jgi:protein involved in polysaccharide export with SLBB domain
LIVLCWASISHLFAQEIPRHEVKQKAEQQLQQMTPQQIEAKIKELGMTREQAEAKAKEYDVDLNTYLQQRITSTGVITPEQIEAMQIESKPDLPKAEEGKTETSKEAEKKKDEITVSQAATAGSGGLRFFGYDIFATMPSAFEPVASGPVDPEYLIGTEDVLRLNVWGQVELRNDMEVDKEGRIFIPTVGPVLVTGLTFEQAYKTLIRQMSKSYAGLVASPPTVWLDITLARLRPKRIFIMGEVVKPGGYTVSSYANVFNSLYSVGGPTVKGSLRDVRVVRGSKVIAHIDLYTYLTGAEMTNDIRLQSNDIVFIPPRGKTVAVKGEVRHPAIFELLAGENLKKLLEYAGGALTTSYLERIQIDRVIPFDERIKGESERKIVDINFREILNLQSDYELNDEDVISIFSVLDFRKNFVSISGAVVRPGIYQWEKIPRLRDLIIEADSLLPEAYLPRADIMRTRPDQTLEAIKVDIKKVLEEDEDENIYLQPLDQVRIYSIYEISDRKFVSISGHVRNPGRYAYADSLTLYDLVFKAGGLTDSSFRSQTFLPRADLIRLNPDGITKKTIPFNLEALLDSILGVNRLLQSGDEVVIYEIDVAKLRNKFVEVRGKVRRPGKFNLTTNMTLADAILLAGGLTEDAWQLSAEVARTIQLFGMGQDSLAIIRFAQVPNFSDTTQSAHLIHAESREKDFQLQHRDIVYIRPNPDFRIQESVTVGGEVVYAGEYALKVHEERLSSIIKRAGGITKSAFLKGGRINRHSNQVIIDFEKALADPFGSYDIILHSNDVIQIPKKLNAVMITGEVNHPGLLGYIDGDNLWNYIDRAGGTRDSADYILLTYPSGNVKKIGTGLFSRNPTVEDGSMINVAKLPPPPPSKEFDLGGTLKDIFAVTASVVTIIVLSKQLK